MKQTLSPNCALAQSVSPFARKCLERITIPKHAHILDIPCGFGRHAIWLASLGHRIVAIDIDADRVAATKKALVDLPPAHSARCIVADGDKSLPIPANSIDLAIVVHYYSPFIFETVARALKPGGHLIFETFGAQGHNWRALPEVDLVAKLLRPYFDVLVLRERKCGPKKANAVVCTLAKKTEHI